MGAITGFRIQASGFRYPGLAIVAWAISVWPAMAVQTKIARHDTYQELAPGRLHSVSLSDQGRLSLAVELKPLYRPDAEILWSMAVAPDGRVFYGAGHEGKIFVTDRKASGTLFLDTDAPEVTALLFHGGKLYAGTASDGNLWVCDPPGTTTLVYKTGEEYVWDLLADSKGNIIVATGTKGKVFKVDPKKKKGALLFDSPDENVLSLALGPKGRLHAATHGDGRVYRWDNDRQTTPVVLFEASEDEVRRIVIDPEGNIYAAANSEVMARRVVSPLSSVLGRPSGSSGSSGSSSPSQSKPAPKPLKPSVPAGTSQVYVIDKEGFVRTLWKATEAPIHDMVWDAERESVVIAAGNKGKIFRLDRRGNYSVILSVEDEQVFALEPSGKQIFLATVGPAATYRLGDGLAREGTYLSPALNAGASVRWGSLRREGNGVDDVEIDTRSGNTKEPDGTWYDWKPVTWEDGPNDGRIQSPVARYFQWRARFKAVRGASQPDIDLVEVFFAPANEAPQIRKINVKKSTGSPSRPSTPSSSKPPTASRSVKKPTGDGKDFEVADNSNTKRFDIAWLVADPNNDPLESALYFKGEDEKTWKLIKDKLTQPKYTFDTGALPDGNYRVKVVVTDRPDNFGPRVRKDELISDRFIIDNTAPEIDSLKASTVRGAKRQWRVTARVSDKTSLIAGARFNINGQKWNVLVPRDGLFDERTELLEFDTDELEGDEHTLGLIVTDRQGNSAVGKILLRP